MKVQLVTPYRVSLLQRYGVTVRGNVTSVYPPLHASGEERCMQSFGGKTREIYTTLKLEDLIVYGRVILEWI